MDSIIQNIMYSTWIDNDQQTPPPNLTDNSVRRLESASKRPPANRIQIVSKLTHNNPHLNLNGNSNSNNNGSTSMSGFQVQNQHAGGSERSIVPPPTFTAHNKIEQLNHMNQTSHLPIRRLHTTDGNNIQSHNSNNNLNNTMNTTTPNFTYKNNESSNPNPPNPPNPTNANILKLMQQQLQLIRKSYEQKTITALKQNSIVSQLSKLKIKLQNNNELIHSKDQLIDGLREELRRAGGARMSPQKHPQPQPPVSMQVQIQSQGGVLQKMADMESKYSVFIEVQNKLAQKIADLNIKIEHIEKGLLSIFACKITKIQAKLTQFTDISMQKITGLQSMLSRLNSSNPLPLKPQTQPHHILLQPLAQKLESLKQQLQIYKTKQFRYENSNIPTLHHTLTHLQSTMLNLEKKFQLAHSRMRNSKCSSSARKEFGHEQHQGKKNGSVQGSSCYFQDYEEVYQEVDSIGEDQFFHPLQQSARRYATKEASPKQPTMVQFSPGPYPSQPHPRPHPHPPHQHQQSFTKSSNTNTKPTTNPHNESFENFTSDEQDQQFLTPNERRLTHTLKLGNYKLPLVVEIDLTGYMRKKADQKYLLDGDKKGFMLNEMELGRCREKGWILW